MTRAILSLSIVSHGQCELVNALLGDLQKQCNLAEIEVLLTLNIPEDLPPLLANPGLRVKLIRNPAPLGFGANHNRAFAQAEGDFFGVLNPDVRLHSPVFDVLMDSLKNPALGVVAPLVVNRQGLIEDSARRFPTPLKILCKAAGSCRGGDYVVDAEPVYPDWLGGMFMLFRREVYRDMGGFDERYFLYYEDVDLCARIWLKGLSVALIPQVRVMHDARRTSHKSASYLKMHIRSMLRFFLSPTFCRVMYLRMRRADRRAT
ncbi:MAG: glycosyltransferase family 2 protein [Polaromonas sp.]